MFVLKNPLLYNHASILDIFRNISHDMDPMRDMILKIREINIQEISRWHRARARGQLLGAQSLSCAEPGPREQPRGSSGGSAR